MLLRLLLVVPAIVVGDAAVAVGAGHQAASQRGTHGGLRHKRHGTRAGRWGAGRDSAPRVPRQRRVPVAAGGESRPPRAA